MASTYSDLKIELIGTGEQSGTWGTTTNTNLGTAIEEAITGSEDVSFSSADVTLTLTDTNTTQAARNLRLNLTGTSGGARVLTVPAIEKVYIINNGLAHACTVKNATGTGISVPAGKTMYLYNDSTNVVDAITHLSSLTLATDLAVADGGTGASTAANARTNLGCGTMATQNATAINVSGGTVGGTTVINTSGNVTASGTTTSSGTLNVTGNLKLDGASGNSGEVIVSQGSGNTPVWGSGFPSGGIIMWSGSVASIPSGWYLCNGANGTPDLRNRFVVGAGSTYSPADTGGSADAIIPYHNHSTSTSVTDPGHTHSLDGEGIFGQARDGTGTPASGFTGGYPLGWIDGINSATTGISVSTTVNYAGSSGNRTNANLPPYYALAFIMKA